MKWICLGIAFTMLHTGCGEGGRGVAYEPAADVDRLVPVALEGDDIGRVRDFDIRGDTIYLLDMTGSVAVISRSDDSLELVRHIARRGGGPGELLGPTGLAVTDRTIIVVERTRLHVFDLSGAALTSTFVEFPCVMGLPAVSPASRGTFVHGNCLRPGLATDTMMGVLAWAPEESTEFELVLDVPRFTRDGRMGTMFGASRLLTTGPAGIHAFGGGETNCTWLIDDTGDRPTASSTCPVADVLYSADAPAEFKEVRASAVGMDMRWPDPMPTFHGQFMTDDKEVLLFRPWSADSLVIQASAPSGSDVAVASIEGFMGCKASGCLWLFDNEEVPRMIVLDREDIERRLRAREQP